MTYKPKTGEAGTRALALRVSSEATLTDLKAVDAKHRDDGTMKIVEANHSLWVFSTTNAATADDILVAAPSSGSGRWLRRADGATVRLSLPFTFATADAAALLTLPTGTELLVEDAHWKIAADMTGGSSSAIGVSSSKTGLSTKGDILGGASGDVAATLTLALSPALGTIGAKMATLANKRVLLVGGDTVRFDRITSAFTAGSGNVELLVRLIRNQD